MKNWITWPLILCLFIVAACGSNDDPVASDVGLDTVAMDQSSIEAGREDVQTSCKTPGPVKIVFLVETSGSMQFTDPVGKESPQRQSAVGSLINHYQKQEHVSFGLYTFNTIVQAQVSSGLFTRDFTALDTAVSKTAIANMTSDFEGALGTLYAALKNEMVQVEGGIRSKSRYVFILLVDGGPNPQCTVGCDNDGSGGLPSLCDLPRSEWCANQSVEPNSEQCQAMDQWYVGMQSPCLAYNSWEEIKLKAQALAQLKGEFGVGAVDFYVVRVFPAELPADQLMLLGLDPVEDAKQLQDLAIAGGGTFIDAMGKKADLTTLDFSAIGCGD